VLKTAGDVRSEKGLVCGVAGYPATDCGGEVKKVSAEAKAADTPIQIAAPASSPSPSATAQDLAATSTSAAADDGGNTTAYVIAGIALLALVAFLLVRSRSGARRAD
jgi:MYXO-CTERM domain-containing protein